MDSEVTDKDYWFSKLIGWLRISGLLTYPDKNLVSVKLTLRGEKDDQKSVYCGSFIIYFSSLE